MEEKYDKGYEWTSFRERFQESRERFAKSTEGFFGRSIGGGKISWGLVILLVTAALAVYNIVTVFLTFIKY